MNVLGVPTFPYTLTVTSAVSKALHSVMLACARGTVAEKDNVMKNESIYEKEVMKRRKERIIDGLDAHKIAARLKNDGFLKNPEYRRQLLCQWLLNSGVHSYDEALTIIGRNLTMRERRIEMMEAYNPPVNLVIGMQRIIDSTEFIKDILVSEKKFVQKYLAN